MKKIKKITTTAFLAIIVSTPAYAKQECTFKDTVKSTGIGAGIGSVAAVASVWTLGVLAAPFTAGGSLGFAWASTPTAIGLGAKGGAVYGGGYGVAVCGKEILTDDDKGR